MTQPSSARPWTAGAISSSSRSGLRRSFQHKTSSTTSRSVGGATPLRRLCSESSRAARWADASTSARRVSARHPAGVQLRGRRDPERWSDGLVMIHNPVAQTPARPGVPPGDCPPHGDRRGYRVVRAALPRLRVPHLHRASWRLRILGRAGSGVVVRFISIPRWSRVEATSTSARRRRPAGASSCRPGRPRRRWPWSRRRDLRQPALVNPDLAPAGESR